MADAMGGAVGIWGGPDRLPFLRDVRQREEVGKLMLVSNAPELAPQVPQQAPQLVRLLHQLGVNAAVPGTPRT